ncbi:hypothetical protein Clacol_001630 [Clathrus columnatus]|uniref:BTB domain-containing protein n=1 Tax=Clathrus columnatus TaxID=1419009 RepID=A0AAV5A1R5_9AGAM|nr:hypothetical protein Clacol_001630 [Clathrus columnatus]
MSNLHAYFALKNEKAFSRLLEASRTRIQPSTPGSSSGKRGTPHTQTLDVNAKDWLGRTVLHLACSNVEAYALTYIRMLFTHPSINVNIQDTESKWTPLHRALYYGNLPACQLLLKRPDIDTQVRDNEGLTPFDLYNITLQGTWPLKPGPSLPCQDPLKDLNYSADLLTWGGNRNATLGHGDSNDRTFPDHVIIPQLDTLPSIKQFTPVLIKAVSMAKLHTAVITDEDGPNLRVCGFGSGGRLQHVPELPYPVTSVSSAQDHTLIVTNRGEVWSWGLNRFCQLGYVLESSMSNHGLGKMLDEPVQAAPRRVLGPLKKEVVVGVSASKTASACWTNNEGDVFTWGTNNGQLDPSDPPSYNPPFPSKPPIIKITACEGTFAALSTRGDVWTFSAPGRSPSAAGGSKDSDKTKDRPVVKPQRVWAAKRSVDPARDVALGLDGDTIICTESGHVFIRSRTGMISNTSKTTGTAIAITKGAFHRVPLIYRAIRVYANSAGAFGALRLNYSPLPILIEGNDLGGDITIVRPWALKDYEFGNKFIETQPAGNNLESEDEQEVVYDAMKSAQGFIALALADTISRGKTKEGLFSGKLKFGADMIVQAGMDIPVHRILLVARSPVLTKILASDGGRFGKDPVFIEYEDRSGNGLSVLKVHGVQSLAMLLFLEFFYSDSIPALDTLPFNHAVQIRREISQLADLFEVSHLLIIGSAGMSIRSLCLGTGLWNMFNACQNDDDPSVSRAVRSDVYINLADRKIACHSVILRSRCLFFENFFEEEAWTISRWTPDKTITVDMQHMEWRGFSYVIKWIYSGEEDTIFDNLDDTNTVQDFVDLIFQVMSIASELLLDRFMLVCSAALLRYITLTNISSILVRAVRYNALSLVTSLQDYIACNLEAIMENRLFDNDRERIYDMEALIPALSTFIRARQADFSPITRSGLAMNELMKRHADWLCLQDIPGPIVRTQLPFQEKQSPRLVPSTPAPSSKPGAEDDIFLMDETPAMVITSFGSNILQSQSTSCTPDISEGFSPVKGVWKSKTKQSILKVDFKTVMAEAAAQIAPRTASAGKVPPVDSLPRLSHRPSGTSPPKLPLQRSPPSAASPVIMSVSASPSNEGVQSATTIPNKSLVRVQPTITSSTLNTAPASSSTPTGSANRRGTNDGPAWLPRPPDVSPSIPGLSFSAIQQQQLSQARPAKVKQSLRQIQDEERARREEEDFLKWWAAEEERVKIETTMALSSHTDASSIQTASKNRTGKPRKVEFPRGLQLDN